MKRLRILLMMLALSALMVLAVSMGSPYAPVAQTAVDIEAIWAIEDAREESERPLVTRLANDGVALGYDRESNTFYCPIGLENGDEWPQIRLTAPGAEGVQLVFVDDYSYDWCAEAVREGYSYELMAYTDTHYAYFNIVFTGLVQVHIDADVELGREDRPAEVSVCTPQKMLKSHARTHYRGGITVKFEKHPYRVEFTRTADGRNKIFQEMPGLGRMNQFILIPMWFDNDMLRDRLSWALYGELVGEDAPYGARRHMYAEVFDNDRYEGVYLLLEPYDHAAEIAKEGDAHAATDSVYCTTPTYEEPVRPRTQDPIVETKGIDLHIQAQGTEPFERLEDYAQICREEDDGVFARRAMEQMDMESMMRYHHIMQSFGLGDNMFNNMFIWAMYKEGKTVYRFIPWDMDMSWGEDDHIEWILEEYDGWMYFLVMDRLLNLNPDGLRTRWADMWRQMRESVLTYENIEEKVNRFSSELNDSGAMVRNSERWGNDNPVSEPFEILNYVQMRFDILDALVEYIETTPGEIPMLIYDDPEMESGVIYGFDGRENDGAMK